jgi:hypothetical protein
MKFEIKSRFSSAVLFSLETGSLKICVEAAVKSRADLAYANLASAYLAYANLAGADLAGANLAGANLARADLAGANLAYANLARADLAYANLAGADLAGANLAGADLAGADLAYANLAGAYLAYANLAGADLAGANLAGADGETNTNISLVGKRPYFCVGPLGSRNALLQAFITDAGVYVRAGCFWDTLDEFKAAVVRQHGDNEHGREYAIAISMIEWHAHLWTPTVEAEKAA